MPTTYRSFAKINLHLEVAGRRQDGYHELRTLFQTVSLCDRVEVSLAGRSVELEVEGPEVPGGEENLACRAARAYLDRWGRGSGVRLRLDKRIPVGGGLGGGSSNAATVLLALRDLTGRPRDVRDLVAPAAALGADVPYFLVGGTALGRGRGDEVEVVPDLDEEELWLVHPGVSVSTAEVFASGRLEPREAADPLLEAVREGRVRRPSDAVGANDLEAAVLRLFPAIKEVYTSLVHNGAEQIRVSGSGSTMFVFRSWREEGRELRSALPLRCRVFSARTLSRASIAARRVAETLGGP